MEGNPPGVDINRASLEELTGLPGLKQKIAERLIAGRPYESIDDLRRVRSLPAGLIESLRPFLSVSPRSEMDSEQALLASGGTPDVEVLAASPAQTPLELEPEQFSDETSVAAPIEAIAPDSAQAPVLAPVEASTEIPVETPLAEQAPVVEPLPEPAASPDEIPPISEPWIEVAPVEPAEPGPDMPAPPAEEPLSADVVSQPVLEAGTVQPATAESPHPLSTGRLIGCGALMGLATMLLTVAVTLLVLLAVNGSLSFATDNQFAALSRQEQDLSSQVNGIQQDVTAMQARLAAVEALSGRVGTLETDQQTLRSNLQNSQQQLEAAQTQLNQLNGRITQIEQRSQAFSQFIEGLRTLVSQIPTTQP